MLRQTAYSIDTNIIDSLLPDIFDNGKHDITYPTGNFFYDPWELKPEFKNTPWEELWNSLPGDKGQARVIIMDSPSCYTQHADIDDRYHLNIINGKDYLIDLDECEMHPLITDGIWYEMDASKLHTAISVGERHRVQVVVRKLLKKNILTDTRKVKIDIKGNQPRYAFDNSLSPWLNNANKNGLIANFKAHETQVTFDVEHSSLSDLLYCVPHEFNIEVKT